MKKICPNCKGKNIVIQVWGLPSGKFLEEMNKEENKGKYQLRGCIVSGDDPDYCCNDCGEEFQKKIELGQLNIVGKKSTSKY